MESLLERSDVPLLVAGPEARAPEWGKPFERVVFATDFRGDAQSALLGAARVAERFRARLVVVSVLDAIAGQGEEWRRLPIVRRRIAEDRDARRRMLDRWLSLGRIEADVHVDDEGRLAKEGVVELARRSPATVVAMTTRRFGPSWYRGNIASAVVRTAPVPVWLATPSQLSRWLQSPPRREAVA
jgi:nucleotide-binding universal stress UspA family protein